MEHNTALFAKWWWKFSKEKDALWVKVVTRKYGIGIDNIYSIGGMYADMGECIAQGFKFKVNSGNKIKF